MRDDSKTLIRGTGIFGGLTVVSRLLGFIRDLLFARLIGAGAFSDAFFVAFRIPNLLRSLVAEGALTSAFVPVFASAVEDSHERAQRDFRTVLGALLLVTIILSLLGILFAPFLISIFAPGFGKGTDKLTLSVDLLRWMFPFIICVSVVSLVNGALNSIGIFGSSPIAQCMMNVVLIGSALLAFFLESENSGVFILAWGVLIGGVLQIIVQIPLLRKGQFSLVPRFALFSPVIREIFFLMIPAIFGAAVYQLTILISTALASLLAEGSVSWLFYADRIVQLPTGIFTVALGTALLPVLSRSQSRGDSEGFEQNLMNSLRFSSFFLIPVTVFIFLFAEPIVRTIFERGSFDAMSTGMTALAVQGLALGIPVVSWHTIIVKAFLARKDTITPTISGIIALTAAFFSSVALMGAPLAASGSFAEVILSMRSAGIAVANLQHFGLALGSVIGTAVGLFMLIAILSFRHKLNWLLALESTGKSFLAAALMMPVYQLQLFETTGFLNLILSASLFGTLYIILSFLFKSSELQETFSALKRFF